MLILEVHVSHQVPQCECSGTAQNLYEHQIYEVRLSYHFTHPYLTWRAPEALYQDEHQTTLSNGGATLHVVSHRTYTRETLCYVLLLVGRAVFPLPMQSKSTLHNRSSSVPSATLRADTTSEQI